MPEEYTDQHYVPQWHQRRFLNPGQTEFLYLHLKPQIFTDSKGGTHAGRALWKQGTRVCFYEEDLYTVQIPGIAPKDIEKVFFGEIDAKGRNAVEYFETFSYPPRNWGDSINDLVRYMSVQRFRTPKGLKWLKEKTQSNDKNRVLTNMIRMHRIYCALWMDSVWQIADASNSNTKFIVSDHPVTFYNREFGPRHAECKGVNDPDLRRCGTHTIFPLSKEKILIVTNLAWVRNPYQSARKWIPNLRLFRNAISKITEIQVLRHLCEEEVRQMNYIIKSRAFNFVAAAEEEWLYPERYVPKSDWNMFGQGHLLMPDPRSVEFGGEIIWGNRDGTGGAIDEYGFRPGDPEFADERRRNREWQTFLRFRGDFAYLFGQERRGRAYGFNSMDPERDSDDLHADNLKNRKKRMVKPSQN